MKSYILDKNGLVKGVPIDDNLMFVIIYMFCLFSDCSLGIFPRLFLSTSFYVHMFIKHPKAMFT